MRNRVSENKISKIFVWSERKKLFWLIENLTQGGHFNASEKKIIVSREREKVDPCYQKFNLYETYIFAAKK